jgi:tryptophan-rich sensory protein
MDSKASAMPGRLGRSRWFLLIGFILAVAGTGLLIGALNVPGTWYAALNKPAFNPPDWAFAPVWAILFVMIALAGFRTFEREPLGPAMKLWVLQIALNFAWSPIFFSLHRIDIALLIIIALFALIVGFVLLQWRSDRAAALLSLPYVAWVGFATTLNAALLFLN